ncbi:MAG: aminotransferase class V-fold PLP-dependent enzyme [Verrucomicrobia bacterium]|nr:aminotransferase class V-fold PLP-dependent enzyme [Verrucomicrobiota bacterium]
MSTEATPLVFKFATEDWEFEQIHRLNYRTFVEEIPQHQASPTHRLVDKFHAENTYLICLCDQKIVGMLAARGNRPFSLDHKVPELDKHLPASRTICEIRLLAIDKKHRGARGGQILSGILALLWQHGVEKGYDLAVISGTVRQLKLYQHLGFVPFGPVVGTGEAQFQPMFVTLETFETTAREFLRNSPAKSFQPSAVNFLPGPVTVRREVRRAFEQAPESHRSESFTADFDATRKLLRELTNAAHVQLMMGSGTLANDAIAAQLSQITGHGVVLINGEFGNRLIDAARRSDLRFETLSFPWGESIDLVMLRQKLGRIPAPAWLWCVHCETSTGVVNDIELLGQMCREHGVKLCVDAISSIGTMDVDLSGVHLASCASGKGLRSYPGLAMVFHNHDIKPDGDRLPRYLDIGYYAEQGGIPFTFSSNLLHALHAALRRVNWQKRFTETVETSAWLRMKLGEMGFDLVGTDALNSPAAITIELPSDVKSVEFGKLMQESGFLLSCNSEYLRRRNWIQICLMGEIPREKVTALVNALRRAWQKRARGETVVLGAVKT